MAETPARTETVEFLERRTREIGWFPEVEVKFSYWHGGRRLMDGSTFCWPNDSVLQDAREEGERLCRAYGIDQNSSLELIACRCDREVVKVRSAAIDRHWQHPETDRGLPRSQLISCRLIWSSKTGDAPPLASWPRRMVTFTKTVPIAGEAKEALDLSGYFFVRAKGLEHDVLRKGLAIGNGAIQDLALENVRAECADRPGRFARITGTLTVAVDPRAGIDCETAILPLVQESIEIESWPNGRGVHWDTTRLQEERTDWVLP
ncbi:hypothetical protein [Cupriavidus sp. TMH.W2]|uniref:hypothetical protein n=1 Tax=Cupriavidus sp. TMH.W2 TaxID=3434465 RepID=UPI003D77B4C7